MPPFPALPPTRMLALRATVPYPPRTMTGTPTPSTLAVAPACQIIVIAT
jgi:hypothetical protein